MNIEQQPTKPIGMTLGPIGQFAIKTTIVVGAFLLSAWIITSYLERVAERHLARLNSLAESRLTQFRATFESATKLGGRGFWTKLETELERLADPKSELSPERTQKLLAQIRVVSDRWRPFILQALPIDPSGPAKP